MANMANISVCDELASVFTNEAKMSKGHLKCLCMKFNDDFTQIIVDEDHNLLKVDKERQEEEPDLHCYDERLAYEKRLFEGMKMKMMSAKGPRFFTWPFYFKNETGCNEKIAIVSWIDDNNLKTKEKMIGASASRALPQKLNHATAVEIHDADEFNYEDLASRVCKAK